MSGYVYFAKVGRYIKVGHSHDPEKRVRNLLASATRYSAPDDCTVYSERHLLATIPGDLGTERECHAALADFAAGGEFFLDEPSVRAFIVQARAGDFCPMPRDAGPYEIPQRNLTPDVSAALDRAFARMGERVVA